MWKILQPSGGYRVVATTLNCIVGDGVSDQRIKKSSFFFSNCAMRVLYDCIIFFHYSPDLFCRAFEQLRGRRKSTQLLLYLLHV